MNKSLFLCLLNALWMLLMPNAASAIEKIQTQTPFFELRMGNNSVKALNAASTASLPLGVDLRKDLSEGSWIVFPEVLMSQKDVASAHLVPEEELSPDQIKPVVQITFTASGKEKLARVSRAYLGLQVVMLVNGRLISGATVRDVISSGILQISLSPLDKKQAQAEINRFSKK